MNAYFSCQGMIDGFEPLCIGLYSTAERKLLLFWSNMAAVHSHQNLNLVFQNDPQVSLLSHQLKCAAAYIKIKMKLVKKSAQYYSRPGFNDIQRLSEDGVSSRTMSPRAASPLISIAFL